MNSAIAESLSKQWLFSGTLTSKGGDALGYTFQITQHGKSYRAEALIIDTTTNAVVFADESKAELNEEATHDWHVGDAFMQYNAITNSWVFGFKKADKTGFNFKVDTLSQQLKKSLRPFSAHTKISVIQAHQLNGIIQRHHKPEQFVTANKTWFRYLETSAPTFFSQHHKSVLCMLNHGEAFYLISDKTLDGELLSRNAWINAKAQPQAMSQFVTLSEREGHYRIQSEDPHFNGEVKINSTVKNLQSGILQAGPETGFCFVDMLNLISY